MYRLNAMNETFEMVTVLEKPMLFSCCRIDRSTVPKGLYMYEVRHDDDMRGDPMQIANWIMVNHWGTLISNEPLNLNSRKTANNAYLDIDPHEDWNYEGIEATVEEYMEQYPPKKEKQRDFER